MIDENNCKELLKKSYKKLKSAVFFDKTQIVLRNKIVEYEMSDNFDPEFESLLNRIKINDCKSYTNSIDVLCFPKKIMSINEELDEKEQNDKNKDEAEYEDKKRKNSPVFITNAIKKETKIKELQYFLDMDVEGYILGIAWLLVIGKQIDDKIYEHSYGNRMRKNLLNENNEATYSPYLFEPYFQQYESWRDKALTYAQKSLNKNQDVIILMLDFKRFFYQIGISKNELTDYVDSIKEESEFCEDIIDILTEFVWDVISIYSDKLKYINGEAGERNILPIGFHPSNVLANLALKKFDDTIINGWNPIYYGRYVDDIIIVEKIEKNSHIYKEAKDGKLTADKVIEYYLMYSDAWGKAEEAKKAEETKKTKNFENGLLNKIDQEYSYHVKTCTM